MAKFFNLFSGAKAQRQSTPAEVNTPLPSAGDLDKSHVPVVCTSNTRAGEFQVELGETEKYLLSGKLIAQSEMVLNVRGTAPGRELSLRKELGTEIYEGDIGMQEKLFVRVERQPGMLPRSKSKVRVTVNGRLAQTFNLRPQLTPHYVVFQHLMPCLFLFVVFYYAFVYRPDVAHFYSQMLSRPQSHQKARQHSLPAPAKASQQIASVDFNRAA